MFDERIFSIVSNASLSLQNEEWFTMVIPLSIDFLENKENYDFQCFKVENNNDLTFNDCQTYNHPTYDEYILCKCHQDFPSLFFYFYFYFFLVITCYNMQIKKK